ncbi:MAG: hypothetical protein DWQ31_00285 [Planctomycetota bacterium]|nr:MAG: hypothetical protein DWQ31_00285 [Planctomycetota bacterium]
MAQRRNQEFVDRPVQSRLVTRAIVQWVVCVAWIGLLLIGWRWLGGAEASEAEHAAAIWEWYAIPLLGGLLLLPLVVVDAVRTSNRFVGPAVRLRHATRRLAAGERVSPLRFRADDFWHGWADDLNTVAARLEAAAAKAASVEMTAEAAAAEILAQEAPSTTDAASEDAADDRTAEATLRLAADLAGEIAVAATDAPTPTP